MVADVTKVLILSRDEELADLLSAVLADAGYATERAREPWEVPALMDAHSPSLLLVDLPWPRASARYVLDVLVSEHVAASLPILALCDSAAVAAEAMAMGNIRRVVVKPFDVDELLVQVEQMTCRGHCIGAACLVC